MKDTKSFYIELIVEDIPENITEMKKGMIIFLINKLSTYLTVRPIKDFSTKVEFTKEKIKNEEAINPVQIKMIVRCNYETYDTTKR